MPPAVRTLLLVPAAAAGAVAGVLGSFVHPLEEGGVPDGLLLAFALSAAVFGTAGLLLGRPGAAAAAAGWVMTVFLLASKRSEGDLVVPGSSAGYLWLLGGLVLGIGCVAVPYPVASRRPLEPSATPEEGR